MGSEATSTSSSAARSDRTSTPRADVTLREKIGVCQWFHFGDREAVERTIALMGELGARHLRTGVSWADFVRPDGRAWYDWQMARLRASGLEVLLSVWHTPPSIAVAPACNAPPRRLRDYADFIDLVITDYGDAWHHLELWNEPNNRYKWDFAQHDPQWRKFGEMAGEAAYWAKQRGRRVVLGGMIPVDPAWLAMMDGYGVLDHVDAVGIHAFPDMWFPGHPNWEWHRDWHGWPAKLDRLADVARGRPIWVTETGLATWDLAEAREAKLAMQCRAIDAVAAAPGERFYLYSLIDLDPARDAIEGFHVDENEYHMGLGPPRRDAEASVRALARVAGVGRVSRPKPRAASALHRAGGQAAADEFLEAQADDRRRREHQHQPGERDAPVAAVLAGDRDVRQARAAACGGRATRWPKQMHLADVAASGEVCIPKPGGFLATHTLLSVPNRMNCRSTKSVSSPVIANPHLTWPSGKPIIVRQDARTSSSRSLSCSFGSMPPTYTRAACIRRATSCMRSGGKHVFYLLHRAIARQRSAQ